MYSKYCIWDDAKNEFSEPFNLLTEQLVKFSDRELFFSDLINVPRYIPVAYSGFKIFKTECKEGDFVLSPSGMYKGEIMYMPDWGKWVVKFRNSYWNLSDITSDIIGNKFQNPELLDSEFAS